ALAAGCVQCRSRNTFDAPAPDQVLVHRVTVNHGGGLTDVPREAKRRGPAVRVPVAPVNHRGKTLVVDGKGHRGADTGAFHPLVVVERTPLGAAVDEVIIDHQAAALADQLCTLVVVDELTAAALGTDRLGMVFCFLFLLFNFY